MSDADPTERHPATAHWIFPPADRAELPDPIRRTNLRELLARPGRFEHHLMVVARIGDMQLEAPTASEPLYFAHENISDEYVLGLPTGDPILDTFPMRVFLGAPGSGEDLARIRHGAGDLLLHPHGLRHWTGRLRPPYDVPFFGEGLRRCGLSLVICAAAPCPPAADRPLFVSHGRDDDVKPYGGASVPALLAELGREAPRPLGRIGNAGFELLVRPARVAPPRGAYLLVLETTEGDTRHEPTDLIYLPPGASLDGGGLERALLFHSDEVEAQEPPSGWREVPAAPFAPFEEGPRGELPWSSHGLRVREQDADSVIVEVDGVSASVPRHWLARMLYRLALHGFRLGLLETYGGFRYDDRPGTVPADEIRIGLGNGTLEGDLVSVPRTEAPTFVECLYRAVAPAGYTEHPV